MATLAFSSHKGGTGKTTAVVNLAASLAAVGKRALVLDLDPQAHATQALGLARAGRGERGMAGVLLERLPLADALQTAPGGFHVVPAGGDLVEVEEEAARTVRPERALEAAVAAIEARYDFVLIDCPTRADGVLSANAFRAARGLVLVVETGAFALHGARTAQRIFRERAEAHGRELGRDLAWRVLVTRFQPRQVLSRELLIAVQARFGERLFDTVVRNDAGLGAAVASGVPLRLLDPNARGAQDFDSLAREILAGEPTPSTSVPTTAAPRPATLSVN